MEELKKPVHPKYLFIITTIIFLLVMYYFLYQYNLIDVEGYLIFSFFWTFFYYLLYRFLVIPEYNDKLRWYEEKKKYQITLEKEREDRRLQKLNDDIEVERIINLNLDINNYFKNDINVRLIELLKLGGELESVKFYKDKTGESLERSKEYVIYLKHNIPSVLKNWDVIEEKRLIDLNKLQTNIILELDKDNNGQIDLIDGESFVKILNKNQKSILEVDKNYIQKFVKISIYLKTKKNNTQKIFE